MAIKLVVFDIAGTTVHDNNNVHEALQKALRQEGYDFTIEEINPYMGIPKPLAIKDLLSKKIENRYLLNDDLYIERIHAEFVKEMISYYQTSNDVREKPNATFVFNTLRTAGIKVVLDTGFSRDITDTILKKIGWQTGVLDGSVCSDEVLQGRPFPDMIYKAMQLTGVSDTQEVAKIGDTSSDMLEGTAAQCKYVIGVTSGAFTAAQLAIEPHTHLVEDLMDVLEIVRG